MADNILKQLYKNTESVSKDIKSMDTTLSKLLKLEQKQDKFDKKKDKEESAAKKRETRNAKRKKADFQGFKGLAKMNKSEKDKEKKGLFEMLIGGLGGFIGKIGGAVGGLASTLLTSLGGLGLGGIITGAMGVIGPALLAALGAFGLKILTSQKVVESVTENVTNPGVAEAGQSFGEQFGVNRDTYRAQLVERFQAGKEKEQGEILADRYAGKPDFFGDVQPSGTMSPEELDDLKKNNEELEDLVNVIKRKNQIESKLDKIEKYLADPSLMPWYQRMGMDDATVLERLKQDKNDEKAHLKTLRSTLESEKYVKIASANEMDMAAYLAESGGYLTRQLGGHINVPGVGEGDKVPMLLPQGSFVLNKMASMHFQTGGMVPTLLEPGEKVFAPGQWDDTISTLNSMIPRFQTGGVVEHLHGDPHRNGYDHSGHGTEANAHDHFAFSSEQLRIQVQQALAEGRGPSGRSWQIGSTTDGQHAPNSYHYSGQAFDVPWSQFGSGTIGQRDYEQSRTLAKDVKALIKELGGNAQNIQQEAGGNIEATARQAMGSVSEMSGNVMGGIGDVFKSAFAGFSAFGEGFTEGLMGSVDTSNPVIEMLTGAIGGISSAVSSFGNLFGGGGDGGNLFGNLFGGGNNSSSPTGTGPIDMGSDVNAKLKKMAEYAMQAGFTKEQAKTMAAIAGGESTFNNRAHNQNSTTRDNSYGLWQINMFDKLGPERRRKYGLTSNDQLFDPVTNARVAKAIFDSQGFGAWGAYTDGNAGKYMNAAQALKLQNGGMIPAPPRGVVNRKPSDLAARMQKAQAQFSQSVSLSVKPIIVYEEEKAPIVSAPSDATMLPPELPDGPGSAMAADYFYQLSLGNQ